MAIREFGTGEVSYGDREKATIFRNGNGEYAGKPGTMYLDWRMSPRKARMTLYGERHWPSERMEKSAAGLRFVCTRLRIPGAYLPVRYEVAVARVFPAAVQLVR